MHAASLTQATAAHYLAQNLFEEHLPRLRAAYKARAQALADALRAHLGAAIVFEEPAGGMFLWARAPGVNAGDWLSAAIGHGVMFVPGHAFHAQPADASTLRLSFASQDVAQLALGVQRMAAALAAVSTRSPGA